MRAGDCFTGGVNRKLNMAAAELAGAFGETFWLRHEIIAGQTLPEFKRARNYFPLPARRPESLATFECRQSFWQ
jgi:hypothetical protein